jgi:hypothetical protein
MEGMDTSEPVAGAVDTSETVTAVVARVAIHSLGSLGFAAGEVVFGLSSTMAAGFETGMSVLPTSEKGLNNRMAASIILTTSVPRRRNFPFRN